MKDLKEEPNTILDYLEQIKERKTLVIVEGKKDVSALKKFGIKRIKPLSKRAIYKVVEEVAENNKECIILTDLDKEGKRLYKMLNHDLNQHGVRINKKFRQFIFKNTQLRQIEGLVTYINHLKDKIYKS